MGSKSDLPPVALTAHVDTLGAVVKEIKPNGTAKLSRIGGIQWPSVETEGVWVFASKGEKVRGSVLIDTASGHVHGAEGSKTPRDDEHMEVRLDVKTTSEKETRELGSTSATAWRSIRVLKWQMDSSARGFSTTRRAWQIL